MKHVKSVNIKIFIIIITSLFISSLNAQPLGIIANYPLIENLSDSTGNNTDVFLEGNPTAPTPPSIGVELCNNGIYIIDPNGQNIQTPIIQDFDITNFSLEIDFKITTLPLSSEFRPRNPIIMGGNFARWIGIYVDSSANMGIKFNNDVTNYRWSTSTVNINTWYQAKIRYNTGTVQLFLDNQLILTEIIGPLAPFQNDFNFTVTDFSEGNPHDGCIKNLIISSPTDTIFINSFE